MLSQLKKLIDKLESLLDKAEEFADSENETTAEKYADVPDYLTVALEALSDAANALEE